MEKSPELDPLAPRSDLDFGKGVRGKHLERVREVTNLLPSEQDLVEALPDSESVNEALRGLKSVAARRVNARA